MEGPQPKPRSHPAELGPTQPCTGAAEFLMCMERASGVAHGIMRGLSVQFRTPTPAAWAGGSRGAGGGGGVKGVP